MNRSKSVIKNTIWEMGYYIIVIAFGFLAPRYIILYYSSEVNGLSSTITHILNIILMLQAGATTAAIYSLYKPISENNHEDICRNIASAERFFKRISFIFGGLMIAVAVVTPFVLNTNLNKLCVFIAFVIMGAKSFMDLYFTAKFRIVFTAFQQKYYISIATLIEQIIYYALVFVTIYFHGHYVFLYVWFLLGCLIKILCLEIMFKKAHPNIKTDQYRGEISKIGDRNYALANEVSHSLMTSSVTILMSFMYGLAEASVYSVYALVSEALSLIATSIYSSFAPGFGNLYAQGNDKNSSRVFSIFQYIYVMLNTFLMMCMLFAVVPFVKIYTAGASDIDYVNYLLATMMVLSGIFSAYRVPYNVIVSSCGFFKETWLQPVISVVICIGISVGLGRVNYSLIMVGLVVFYIINFVYQHFKIKKLLPWMVRNKAFVFLLISLVGIVITCFLNTYLIFPDGVLYWILYSVLFAVLVFCYIIVASLLVARTEFFESVRYLKRLIKK